GGAEGRPSTPAATAAQTAGPATPPGDGTPDPVALLREHTCLACHQLDGEGGPIGPALDAIGATRDAAYIRRSILEPNADTAAGYESVAGTMPANFGDQLTAAQLEAMVRYLAGREGGG
ncbi:MAG: c-type cytochrome, partial [Gemmatimonadetes bacterium]|nr:c-type cytochrome [Gemmatimonadota bacterium]NIQ57481.1 c-type cytochrome [Gemmatimonadota bacterium]NIU77645.1 c-type cytochrome [Gammaproteobacteria bacterium]NIX46819.1 c-type cytochrome [Gemmatimonadota bacterium]NIY11178.1 c-type cytochrome [Gemmatimonadota bacterium]